MDFPSHATGLLKFDDSTIFFKADFESIEDGVAAEKVDRNMVFVGKNYRSNELFVRNFNFKLVDIALNSAADSAEKNFFSGFYFNPQKFGDCGLKD